MIQLPSGGQFDENDLVTYIQATGRNSIIQGQQNATLANHTKQESLDYWLRQFATNQDTRQAENAVLDALAAAGLFEIINDLECPETGEICKGVRLVG